MEVTLAEAAAPRRLLERLVVRPVVRLVAPRADGTAYPLDDLKEEGGAVTHRLGEDLKAMAVVISSVGAWHMGGGGGVERRVFGSFLKQDAVLVAICEDPELTALGELLAS